MHVHTLLKCARTVYTTSSHTIDMCTYSVVYVHCVYVIFEACLYHTPRVQDAPLCGKIAEMSKKFSIIPKMFRTAMPHGTLLL